MKNDWFEIWWEDKQSMLNTMLRNMNADLECGYNYFGNSIRMQKEKIEAYKQEMDFQIEKFKEMDEKKVQRWCYYDLKKRGAIA